jgi:hypothetical protein
MLAAGHMSAFGGKADIASASRDVAANETPIIAATHTPIRCAIMDD